jgi:hypothetical protein
MKKNSIFLILNELRLVNVHRFPTKCHEIIVVANADEPSRSGRSQMAATGAADTGRSKEQEMAGRFVRPASCGWFSPAYKVREDLRIVKGNSPFCSVGRGFLGLETLERGRGRDYERFFTSFRMTALRVMTSMGDAIEPFEKISFSLNIQH